MLAFLASLFSSLLESSVARFIATKIMLTSIFLFVLPVVLNNFVYKLMQIMIEKVNNISVNPVVISFSGLAGYLASHLRIPEGVSILMSALALRMTLNLIKKVW